MATPIDTQQASQCSANNEQSVDSSWGSQFSGQVPESPQVTIPTTTYSIAHANPGLGTITTSTPVQGRMPFNLRAPTFVPSIPVRPVDSGPGHIVFRGPPPQNIGHTNPNITSSTTIQQTTMSNQPVNTVQPPQPGLQPNIQPVINMPSEDPNRAPTFGDLINMQHNINSMLKTQQANVEEYIKSALVPITKKVQSLETQNDLLKRDLATCQVEIQDLREASNHNAQYSRRSTIRVLGIPETTSENCAEEIVKALTPKVMPDLKSDDIEIAHRVGRPSSLNTKPRHIIARLKFRGTKDTIMKNKRQLKGSNVLVFEDLSPLNRQLLDHVKKSPDIETAWSSNGKILGKLKNGSIRQFSLSDMGL